MLTSIVDPESERQIQVSGRTWFMSDARGTRRPDIPFLLFFSLCTDTVLFTGVEKTGGCKQQASSTCSSFHCGGRRACGPGPCEERQTLESGCLWFLAFVMGRGAESVGSGSRQQQ